MKKIITGRILIRLFLLGLLVSLSFPIKAAPLEDVSVALQGEVVKATVKLTTPVRFLRYVPSGRSRLIEVSYEATPGSNATDPWVDREVRNSPETMLTPAFSVTTRDQATQPKMVLEFAREVDFKVTLGPDGRSFVVTIIPEKPKSIAANGLLVLPVIQPPVLETSPKAEGDAVAENNKRGYVLMQAGRDALASKNYPAATGAFNKLLMLPPNQYSQDAQEWVGVARERGGQSAKAKVEYELYLKLFTSGPGVQRVKQRLAGLSISSVTGKMDAPVKKIQERSFAQGGISSRYYYGKTDLVSTYTYNGTSQTSEFSLKDQSSLISNLDATQRYINETYDNRIVFRNVHTKNFLPGKEDRNRLNAAYIEIKNRPAEYSARLGRQTSAGGGVMGRFDGLSVGYGSAVNYRMNAVAGKLVDFTNSSQPVFYGFSVDTGPVSLYAINQTLDGFVDRRAVGTEYRYFDGAKTAFALLDYDIYFKVLNAATINGSYGVESTGTTYSFMMDYRKSPSISVRNALNGSLVTSVKDLLLTEEQLKELAILRTGSVAYSQFGVTQKLSPEWQLGTDIKVSKVEGMLASGCDPLVSGDAACNADPRGFSPVTEASGLDKTITVQLIGNNLYSEADMTSIGASLISSDYVKSGQAVFIYNRSSWDRELYFDTSWNFYKQDDNYGGSMTRNMPMFRVAYQVLQALSLDVDVGIELTNSSGPSQTSTNRRLFGSLGFRWDF